MTLAAMCHVYMWHISKISEDIGYVFFSIADRSGTGFTHITPRLVLFPHLSRHFRVKIAGLPLREFLLQGVVDNLGRFQIVLHQVQEQDAVPGIGGEMVVLFRFVGQQGRCGYPQAVFRMELFMIMI
jgi:hypothetical protein